MTETPKRSLAVILSDINEMDNTVEQLDEAAYLELFDQLKDKVDDYKKAIDSFEDKAERNQKNAQFFQKRAQGFKRLVANLEARMTYHMQSSGFEKLKGDLWAVRLKVNPPKVVVNAEAKRELFVAYSQFMTVDYGWDKKALKTALERDDADAKAVASLERGVTVDFDSADSPAEKQKRTRKGA